MKHEVVLSKIFDRSERALLDIVTGELKAADQAAKPVGNCRVEAGHTYALYADGGVLYVQRDAQRWPIASPEVNMRYGHDLDKETTTFDLVGHSIAYPAWWKDDPTFEPAIPERDEEEDYLAYLVSVWQQPDLQETLLKAWSGAAAAAP